VPGITTAPALVERTVRAITGEGLSVGGMCVARLDPGVREHFLGFLEREYPHLVDGYTRLYVGKSPPQAYVDAVKRRGR
jgi:hypothetical protein